MTTRALFSPVTLISGSAVFFFNLGGNPPEWEASKTASLSQRAVHMTSEWTMERTNCVALPCQPSSPDAVLSMAPDGWPQQRINGSVPITIHTISERVVKCHMGTSIQRKMNHIASRVRLRILVFLILSRCTCLLRSYDVSKPQSPKTRSRFAIIPD